MMRSGKTTTGRNTVVRSKGKLNLIDLLSASIIRLWQPVRRTLAGFSAGVVIGAAAIGTGGTLDPRKAPVQSSPSSSPRIDFAAQSPLRTTVAAPAVAAPKPDVELMHDVTEEPAAHPIISVPQTVTAMSSSKSRIRTIRMEVTAYCSCKKCCGPNAAGLTASGKDISYNDGRFVAADTNVLPFGTKLVIKGYSDNRPVEVIDRGSAIKGNKLDVFYASHEEALKWGRQIIEVTVIE